ncbi:MAG TPA: GNAT family N-acetyltransferase [Nevskiaceae bacterium]|nr:GNAT family N-acetyltransferase [Nevskiaceae bacterium]
MGTRNLAALQTPRSVVLVGEPRGALQQRLAENLLACTGPQRPLHVCAALPWPAADLAVIVDAALATPATVEAFAQAGGRALLWAADSAVPEEFLRACRPARVRVLGPRSCGAAHAASGFNATWLEQAPLPGRVALIAQSRSVAAAVLDFALGRRLGFSWLAVSGGEADVDVADLLDQAALDPHTRAVVLELRKIGQARKFMSAARAAARIKPVVVLQSPRAGDSGPDPVRSAAFARAGLVECDDLNGLFHALAALERLPPTPQYRVALAGNGAGLCALGSAALARHGVAAATISEASRAAIGALNAQARFSSGSADLGEMDAAAIVAALRVLLADGGADLVMLVHGPGTTCSPHTLAQALAQAQIGPRLLAVWPGLEQAGTARTLSAAAGIATFATAEQAAQAVRDRLLHDLNRQLLTQTPPADPPGTVDAAACTAQLRDHLDAGDLPQASAAAALRAYGLHGARPAAAGEHFDAALECHAELGMQLSLQLEARHGSAPRAYALPPLDPLLAARMLADAGVRPGPDHDALSHALIRLGRMAIEQPLLRVARLRLQVQDGAAVVLPGLQLRAAPPLPERLRLALAPYPSQVEHVAPLGGGVRYRVRAIRPSDEPALIGLLQRLDPDEVRYRFFIHLRHFSHDMAARMTQIDYDRELALVAFVEGHEQEVVGTGTLIADADGREAEFALLVHHAHARRGLGRHLLTRLLEHARAQGIGTVYGDVLADNRSMLTLAQRLGFSSKPDPLDPGCRRVEISLAGGSPHPP